MKIALFGAGGQLAHDVMLALTAADHAVIGLTRAEADLRDSDALARCLDGQRPDWVINAAAYNLVDQAESEPAEAFAVNALGPRALALACATRSLPLVHFSTDYVFGLDASRQSPWRETDAAGPVSAYGVSKLAGEYFVQALCPRHHVLRVCGLYGINGSRGKGGNFVETMLRLADSRGGARVVNDQFCTPTYTVDIAAAVVSLLANPPASGVYHLTNGGGCSWHEFAAAIFAAARPAAQCTPIPTSEYPTPARRPSYSVLDGAKWRAAGLPAMPPWRDALERYLSERRDAGRG